MSLAAKELSCAVNTSAETIAIGGWLDYAVAAVELLQAHFPALAARLPPPYMSVNFRGWGEVGMLA